MSDSLQFFKPDRFKLVFLLEWFLFCLLSLMTGALKIGRQLLQASYPLLFFYVIGCTLAARQRRVTQIAPRRWLVAIAGGLVALDQLFKTGVVTYMPYQARLPLLGSWLALAHERNVHGSWIVAVLDLPHEGITQGILWMLALTGLLLSLEGHRNYLSNYRKSLWVDAALIGILATMGSWMIDMAVRGFIVDYIAVAGLVAADLKDITMSLALGCIMAEMLDNLNRPSDPKHDET